jgi:hypothetical protein
MMRRLCYGILLLVIAFSFFIQGSSAQRGSSMDEKVFKLLRAAVVSWDITESGAPTIDPEMPYGTTSLVKDIRRITEAQSAAKAHALHRETEEALSTFLRSGHLKPGVYSYDNLLLHKNDDLTIDITKEILPDQRGHKKIIFEVKEEHLKLMRAASVQWTEWDEEMGSDFYPTPGIDPKRPYGDRTFYIADMAEILGIRYKKLEELNGKKDFFLKLHYEMQPTLQIFLKYGTLPK